MVLFTSFSFKEKNRYSHRGERSDVAESAIVKKRKRSDRFEEQGISATGTEFTERKPKRSKLQDITMYANVCLKAAAQKARAKKRYIPGSFLTPAEKEELHDRKWKQLQELKELQSGKASVEISIDSIVSLMQVLNIADHEEENRKAIENEKLEAKEREIRQRIEKRLWLKKQSELVEFSRKELKEVENLLKELDELLGNKNNCFNIANLVNMSVADVIYDIVRVLANHTIKQNDIDQIKRPPQQKKECKTAKPKHDENSPPSTMKPKFKCVPISFP
ncbi:hypothetical protein DPMN_117906 [Dreissena polymorpha]|uniref:Uncharacterized protein n=1 Tax=Dreissena polymorpha TaxID=45954 RepID=A0A9D4GJV0_DREPO|nr:hypothetical protein DPMN_117906 [Dreissena polymorpha]